MSHHNVLMFRLRHLMAQVNKNASDKPNSDATSVRAAEERVGSTSVDGNAHLSDSAVPHGATDSVIGALIREAEVSTPTDSEPEEPTVCVCCECDGLSEIERVGEDSLTYCPDCRTIEGRTEYITESEYEERQ